MATEACGTFIPAEDDDTCVLCGAPRTEHEDDEA